MLSWEVQIGWEGRLEQDADRLGGKLEQDADRLGEKVEQDADADRLGGKVEQASPQKGDGKSGDLKRQILQSREMKVLLFFIVCSLSPALCGL